MTREGIVQRSCVCECHTKSSLSYSECKTNKIICKRMDPIDRKVGLAIWPPSVIAKEFLQIHHQSTWTLKWCMYGFVGWRVCVTARPNLASTPSQRVQPYPGMHWRSRVSRINTHTRIFKTNHIKTNFGNQLEILSLPVGSMTGYWTVFCGEAACLRNAEGLNVNKTW